MAACPHCRRANPDLAGVCARCGGVLGIPAGSLPRSLPAPMVEPIDAPPVTAREPLPDCPALTVPFGGKSSALEYPERVRPPDPTPPPATLLDRPVTDPQTRDRRAPGGTLPAHPGLPGHPMHDSALQNPPMTIPATAPADKPPPAVPAAPPVHPKLVVLRGMRINAEYPVYEGRNTVGRFADRPVDIDLMSQESVEQIWCSRLHAAVLFEKGVVAVEDLNSLNGTWVNGSRVHPGQPRRMNPGDILQIGTVQMRLVIG